MPEQEDLDVRFTPPPWQSPVPAPPPENANYLRIGIGGILENFVF
jgi:hypothetical protein